MKKIFNLALVFIFSMLMLGMYGCSNTGRSMKSDAQTMRIWIAPSHRSNTDVDVRGNIYVDVGRY